MQLSKLYSNKPSIMKSVLFKDGLNVVLGEVHVPKEHNKDTHNLGKTTLCKLLDFCFLSRKSQKSFLFDGDRFEDFVFFLEIKLRDASYVTIRRSVAEPNKVSIRLHKEGNQDFSLSEEWDHQRLAFDKAKKMLDGYFAWKGMKGASYRIVLSYLLRAQEDYDDVFNVKKFGPKHSDWKPFVSFLLGLNYKFLLDLYKKRDLLSEKKENIKNLKKEFPDRSGRLIEISNILDEKRREVSKIREKVDILEFNEQDRNAAKELAFRIDADIAGLNQQRYLLLKKRKRLEDSLSRPLFSFDLEKAEEIFKEANVLFAGQLKRDFEQLILFNKEISVERGKYLEEDLSNVNRRIREIDFELESLNKERSEKLSFLTKMDVFDKYKALINQSFRIEKEVAELTDLKSRLEGIDELENEVQEVAKQCEAIKKDIEEDLERQSNDPSSKLSNVRLYFNEIVSEVIGRKVGLNIEQSKDGYLNFNVGILNSKGERTSAGEGHSYSRLLCIAFDLAILRAHLDESFPRFVYHDGVFESLDNRKKKNLLRVIERYASFGLQPIVTAIDADLPDDDFFSDSDVVLKLHDRDDSGRLFNMPKW